MLEHLKKILLLIQENKKEINSFCCRAIVAFVIFGFLGGFFCGALIKSELLADIIIGISLLGVLISSIIAVFTGDFSSVC
jgi:hypothetical protein